MNRSIAFLVVALSCAASLAQLPEDVLKDKGLTRVGTAYVLEVDAKLPDTLKDIRAAEKKYKDANAKRIGMQKDLDNAVNTLQGLHRDNEIETEKLNNTNKSGYASYNRQVDTVNTIRRKINEGIKYVDEQTKAIDKMPKVDDTFTPALLALSDEMETALLQYEVLAADADVTQALAKAGDAAKTKLRLGPSEKLKVELPGIRTLRLANSATTIKLEPHASGPRAAVMFGDQKALLSVDPKAPMIILTADTASKLTLKDPAEKRTIKLTTPAVTAEVKSVAGVTLGEFTISDLDVAVLPAGTAKGTDVLGANFLKKFVYRVELASSSIRLSQIGTAASK